MSHRSQPPPDPYALALDLADGDARRVVLTGDGYLVVNRPLTTADRRRVREVLPGGNYPEWPPAVERRGR